MFDRTDILFFSPGRPPPFYEALAKEAYNTHISNPEVSFLVINPPLQTLFTPPAPLLHHT